MAIYSKEILHNMNKFQIIAYIQQYILNTILPKQEINGILLVVKYILGDILMCANSSCVTTH